MGDSPQIGFMKGFHVRRKSKTPHDEEMLDALQSIGEKINDEREFKELLFIDKNFAVAMSQLPSCKNIWAQSRYSSCSISDQGGCNIGWHWKSTGEYWKEFYDPTEKDLLKLKEVLKDAGFVIDNEIKDGIIAYEG